MNKLMRKISDAYYWVKDHTLTRWHIIDIRSSGEPGYRYGWLDRDQVMLLACFRILVDFIEKEAHEGYGDPASYATSDEDPTYNQIVANQLKKEQELLELYRWWTSWRGFEAAVQAEIERPTVVFTDCGVQLTGGDPQYRSSIDYLSENDQAMLKRLIELREYMWT